MEYFEEERKNVIKELLNSNLVMAGQLVNYTEFLELYRKYEKEMSEQDFRTILGMSAPQYMYIKNKGGRAQILKEEIVRITKEEKKKIVYELLNIKKIEVGQMINYTEFLELYKAYENIITEKEFAELLGISSTNYSNIKNRKSKTMILREKNEEKNILEINEEKKEKIIHELLNSKKIKVGQMISYMEFLELYKPYKEDLTEMKFAELLCITSFQYSYIKSRRRMMATTAILEEKENSEEKNQIIERVLNEKGIKAGQLITYEEFLELHKVYGSGIAEKEFAELLDMTYSSYNYFKYGKKSKARILKNKIENNITDIEKEEILEELLNGDKVKPGQSIDYIEFLNLYEPYKEKMKEKEFAELLGISYSSYFGIKDTNRYRRAVILKERVTNLREKDKEDIVSKLFDGKIIKNGQIINYIRFLELYKPYKEKMKETEFAELLGINYSNFNHMKNGDRTITINDYQNKRKRDRIKYIISKEQRYYSKEELDQLSKKLDLDFDDLIKEICFINSKDSFEYYKELLERKGKIYVGQVKCSKKFAKFHSKGILECAQEMSKKICKRYGCERIQEEIASQSIIHILERCGRIEKNFGDDEQVAKALIKGAIINYIKRGCLYEFKRPRTYSFHRRYTNYRGEENNLLGFNIGIKDKSQNVQDEVEEKVLNEIKHKKAINPEEKCIEVLRANIEAGLSREEALARTGEMLEMSPEEMLKSMQKYMIEQKRVKQTSSGRYIVGEEDER